MASTPAAPPNTTASETAVRRSCIAGLPDEDHTGRVARRVDPARRRVNRCANGCETEHFLGGEAYGSPMSAAAPRRGSAVAVAAGLVALAGCGLRTDPRSDGAQVSTNAPPSVTSPESPGATIF